jgi:O-antigen ligase
VHDTALLAAVFYAPIFWGQVSIPETTGAGMISASAGQTVAAGLVFLALLSALLARWAAGEPPARLPNAVHLPAVLLLAVAAVSTLFSVNPHASKIELSRLLVGFLLFYLVANRATLPAARPSAVAAAFACSILPAAFIPLPEETGLPLRMFTAIALGIAVAVMVTEREDADLVVWLRNALILSAALVVALNGWREKLGAARELRNPTWQIFSTFFNPNMLGGFFAMMFPLALSATIADRALPKRLLWGFCAIALAVTIIPTRSKGAMAALAAAALLYLVLLARQTPRLRRVAGRAVIAAAVAAVAAALVGWQVAPARGWFVAALRLNSQSNMFRVFTWEGTVRLFEAYPWIGAGPAAFKYVYPRYAILGYVEAAHENYLQMFAELGVFGGLVFLWLLASILLTGRRAIASASEFSGRVWAIGGICSLTALMVHSLLDYDWYIGAINFSFWLVAGMLAHIAGRERIAAPVPAEAAPMVPGKRGRRRAQLASPPELQLPGRRARFVFAWTALVAVACVAAWYAIGAPARNAHAQPALDTGDAYAGSGSRQAGPMALAQYDRARQLDPAWPEAWWRYGLVLGMVKGMDDGVAAIQHAHELSPTGFNPLSAMGQLYGEYGETAEAIRYYEKVLALFPNHTRTMRRLADAYAKLGDQQKALEMYSRLAAGENAPYNKHRALSDIDVDTNFAFAHYELGRAAQKAHDRGEKGALGAALKHYDATLRITAEYFARAEKTDEMFKTIGRPREYRAEDMKMLEAKARWRNSLIYQRVGMTREAQQERTRAPEIWSGVEQAVAQEDKPR